MISKSVLIMGFGLAKAKSQQAESHFLYPLCTIIGNISLSVQQDQSVSSAGSVSQFSSISQSVQQDKSVSHFGRISRSVKQDQSGSSAESFNIFNIQYGQTVISWVKIVNSQGRAAGSVSHWNFLTF